MKGICLNKQINKKGAETRKKTLLNKVKFQSDPLRFYITTEVCSYIFFFDGSIKPTVLNGLICSMI